MHYSGKKRLVQHCRGFTFKIISSLENTSLACFPSLKPANVDRNARFASLRELCVWASATKVSCLHDRLLSGAENNGGRL